MPARAKTLLAMLLCMFLCFFGGAAAAQTANKQTVLLLTTARQSAGNGPINNENAYLHFSSGDYGNANVRKFDGVLSDDNRISEYTEAFKGLKPGDAVVVITGNNEVQGSTPNPTITNNNINALKNLMQNAKPEQGIAFFIFADGDRKGFTASELSSGALSTSNVQRFVDIVNDLTGWPAEAKLRFGDQIKNATNSLGDNYKTRYPDTQNHADRNRYDFRLAENPTYKNLFKNLVTSYNGDAGLQAISGATHAAITNVPKEFVLYSDLPVEVIDEINDNIVQGWSTYDACTGCFAAGDNEPDYGRAYAVFAGHKDTGTACVFLAGDSSMFTSKFSGGVLARTLMEVAKSPACACTINPATGKCCDADKDVQDSFTGQQICCNAVTDTIANQSDPEFAMCCHEGKAPARELGGSMQLCCPTGNIGKETTTSTESVCCGQYKVGKVDGVDGVCCGAGEDVAPADGQCCNPDNISAAGTCCATVTFDDTGKKVCCDGDNQAVVGSGSAARCYDKSLVGQDDAGENILCEHGVGSDGKCADQGGHVCSATESERTEQKVLFLSTDEWTDVQSLDDICTSPSAQKNQFGQGPAVTDEADCRLHCKKLMDEPDHDIPESQWTAEQAARLKPLKDACLRVAYDSERVELEKRRGDFFVENAYNAFEAVVGKENMLDYRGVKDVGLEPDSKVLSEAGWVADHQSVFDNLPKGSVVVIATEYRPMHESNATALQNIMKGENGVKKRDDLTFVIFADGCRTCNRQFADLNTSNDAEYGEGNAVGGQPAVLLPATQPSNLERFAAIVSGLGTKAGDNIIVKSRIGEIFGRKQSTYLDADGNPVQIGTGEEERQVAFALNDGKDGKSTAVNQSLFAKLPVMDGYNPSVLTGLNTGYALYGDLTDKQIEWGQNLVRYQDCVESHPKCTPDSSDPKNKWTGGYVSNRDYRADPAKFETGAGERGVAMFISREDYNGDPGPCLFLSGDLSFFDRHGKDDPTQTDHTGQHTKIASILMKAAVTEKCTPPEIKDCLTCDAASGYNTIPKARDGEIACCADDITVKDGSSVPTKCCTETGILNDEKTDCCAAAQVLKDDTGKPKACCADGITPAHDGSVDGAEICCTTGNIQKNGSVNVCCKVGDVLEGGKCVTPPTPPGPTCDPGQSMVGGVCCWDDESKRIATCGDGETPDKVCCKYLCPGGSPQECKPGQIVDGDCGCKCNMPYEERPYCEEGQVPAPYISKSGRTGDTKAAVVACCRPRPTPGTGTPVPVNSPWALGLLGAAVAFAAARRRRQSKRRDDDA